MLSLLDRFPKELKNEAVFMDAPQNRAVAEA